MKIVTSRKTNAFGGLNFVHKELRTLNIEGYLRASLPVLPPQSRYTWNDIFSTLLMRSQLKYPMRMYYKKTVDPSGSILGGSGPLMLTPGNKPILPSWYKK